MELYFATSNKHKVEEMQSFLRQNGIDLVLKPFGDDVVEPATEKLEDIAAFKAELGMKMVNRPVMAEDTGLFLHALNGFPGPHSKWVHQKLGLEGILQLLQGKPRVATFRTGVALAIPGQKTVTFIGEMEGTLSDTVRGTEGWGFDPVFIPEGSNKTWAEDYSAKYRDSHRARALQKLVDYLKENPFKD